jgi:hypothetical protein
MHNLLLFLISLTHTLLVIFIIITPFLGINYLLLLHAMTIPFVIIHWLLSDDTCILTLIERNIQKKIYGDNYKESECFTCKLVKPVYNFIDDYPTFSKLTYTVTIVLWSLSVSRLVYKYKTGAIQTLPDLFSVKM